MASSVPHEGREAVVRGKAWLEEVLGPLFDGDVGSFSLLGQTYPASEHLRYLCFRPVGRLGVMNKPIRV